MLRMDERPKADAIADIGVDVGADIDAAIARGLNEHQSFCHQGPIVLAGGLKVIDVNGNLGFFPDSNGFLNSFEQLSTLVAHMREVDAARLAGDFCELNN